jgi:hypothetical protein
VEGGRAVRVAFWRELRPRFEIEGEAVRADAGIAGCWRPPAAERASSLVVLATNDRGATGELSPRRVE